MWGRFELFFRRFFEFPKFSENKARSDRILRFCPTFCRLFFRRIFRENFRKFLSFWKIRRKFPANFSDFGQFLTNLKIFGQNLSKNVMSHSLKLLLIPLGNCDFHQKYPKLFSRIFQKIRRTFLVNFCVSPIITSF